MSRTDLDPATLACSLRRMAGDGSVEWVMEPIQAAVLHDIADLLDESAKLRELVLDLWRFTGTACKKYPRLFDPDAQGGQMVRPNMLDSFDQRIRELGVEVEP